MTSRPDRHSGSCAWCNASDVDSVFTDRKELLHYVAGDRSKHLLSPVVRCGLTSADVLLEVVNFWSSDLLAKIDGREMNDLALQFFRTSYSLTTASTRTRAPLLATANSLLH